MIINFSISSSEKRRLLEYADFSDSQDHWGSSSPIIPEYLRLRELIVSSKGNIELTIFNCDHLISWMRDCTYEGGMLILEDISLIYKMTEVLIKYYSNHKFESEYEQQSIINALFMLDKLHSNKEFLEHIKSIQKDRILPTHAKERLLNDDVKVAKDSKEIENQVPVSRQEWEASSVPVDASSQNLLQRIVSRIKKGKLQPGSSDSQETKTVDYVKNVEKLAKRIGTKKKK